MRKLIISLGIAFAVIGCSNTSDTVKAIEQDYWFLFDENKEDIPYVIDSVKHLPKSTQERLLYPTLFIVSDEDKNLIWTHLSALEKGLE